jgi:hypothetical protein
VSSDFVVDFVAGEEKLTRWCSVANGGDRRAWERVTDGLVDAEIVIDIIAELDGETKDWRGGHDGP